jgi:hypothetical protein
MPAALCHFSRWPSLRFYGAAMTSSVCCDGLVPSQTDEVDVEQAGAVRLGIVPVTDANA